MNPVRPLIFARQNLRTSFLRIVPCCLLTLLLWGGISGCDDGGGPIQGKSTDISRNPDGSVAAPTYNYYDVDPQQIQFKDELESNVAPPEHLEDLTFIDSDGASVTLKDYLGKKNVVLVFTQGYYGGSLCPYCTTQTARLVANYKKFQDLETEILVVYPGDKMHLEDFLKAARGTDKTQLDKVPFPVLLDEGLSAVDFFGIRAQVAHPSTYVIDKEGKVLLAYVGQDHSADRPSIQRILEVLQPAETPAS